MGGEPGAAEQFGQQQHGHHAAGQRPVGLLPGRGGRACQPPSRIHPHRDDGTGGQATGARTDQCAAPRPGVAHRAQAGAGDGANRRMVAVRSTAGT